MKNITPIKPDPKDVEKAQTRRQKYAEDKVKADAIDAMTVEEKAEIYDSLNKDKKKKK